LKVLDDRPRARGDQADASNRDQIVRLDLGPTAAEEIRENDDYGGIRVPVPGSSRMCCLLKQHLFADAAVVAPLPAGRTRAKPRIWAAQDSTSPAGPA
jgi:hypothetical protein